MAAYYNEIDPFCVGRLKKLMRRGIIADGEVDQRSIEDVLPDDILGYDQCHFFAGVGGWSMALRLIGWPDERRVWTGSCPCQPFSAAGKGDGFADERHLWPAFHWLISQCRPAIVFGEQVSGKRILPWFDLVSDDLEAAGYSVRSCDFPAASVGSPTVRQRLYWCGMADADREQRHRPASRPVHEGLPKPANNRATGGMGNPDRNGRGTGQRNETTVGHRHAPAPAGGIDRPGKVDGYWANPDWLLCRDQKWRPVKSGLVPLVDGSPERIALLRAIGNAIVPQQAAAFIKTVMEVCDMQSIYSGEWRDEGWRIEGDDCNLSLYTALTTILDSYEQALAKHPDETWPEDIIHMIAIMAEEAGEAVRAANDAVHAGASLEPLRTELAQTAAMCIRCLINLEDRA